jgi:lipoyl synthase
MCDYCQGHYLEGMVAVGSAEGLLALARRLEAKGAKGFLLSGGCDSRGKVPLRGFLGAVARVKEETSLSINIHTGIIDDPEEARALVSSGADCMSVDIVQDPTVINRRMHLERGPEDYARTLDLLFAERARMVAPHVCIGLSSSIEGEISSLRLISRYPVSSVILLSFLPARGKPMSSMKPPERERIIEVAKAAVEMVKAPVAMGCMRPRGDWELETELIRSGVRSMAMPSLRTVRWAESNGIEAEWREECCSIQR